MESVKEETENAERNGKLCGIHSSCGLMTKMWWAYMVGGLWTIDRGRDRGVAVGSSVMDLSFGVGFCLGLCVGARCHKGQNLGENDFILDSMYWFHYSLSQ